MEILNCLSHHDNQADIYLIRQRLARYPMRLRCKYFYDAQGSRLFEEICRLPEYYLTRTEAAILAREAQVIMAFFTEENGDLVELGSGSNHKIKLLLNEAGESISNRIRYVPVDISASALLESTRELLYLYPDLPILGLIADFTRHLEVLPPGRKLITFLGSTIGNFSDQERSTFLKHIAAIMNPADRLLLGLDMIKPIAIIEAAYNDSRGVTAAFNKNILRHLNDAWEGDFNPDDFEHLAWFNPSKERVEMYLQATHPVSSRLAALDLSVVCREGEVILTETCQKFSPQRARQDFLEAGLVVDSWFSDDRNWFSLVSLKKR
jgi:L-histidine N-alpha-methyltransferase